MPAVIEKIRKIFHPQPGNIVLQDVALASAREDAIRHRIGYAGTISPHDAWRIFSLRQAKLVDVRTSEELKFVGHVEGSLNVPWQLGPNMIENPHFIQELEQRAYRQEVIFLLCRSGRRSVAAAEAATLAGFKYVFNIYEGFEGDLDQQQQRGLRNGWRYRGLPWVQD